MIRGSKWIKCDLHIHSPASFFHQYGDRNNEDVWEKYISDLENLPEEFKILGINDYLTLDGYRRVIEFKRQGRLKNIECLLPVIEFRIDIFAGENKLKRINYHVIFSNEVNLDIIQAQFLNSFTAAYTLEGDSEEADWVASLTDDALIDLGKRIKKTSPNNQTLQNENDWNVGFNNFNVSYDALKKILDKPPFRGRFITAIGKGEWDDYRWDAGGAALKRSIINNADLVFLSCENAEHYNLAKKKLHDAQVNERLLDCSDAHYYSTVKHKDRIGNCNTWLKIEPTFNGLKQVLFVPEERICVSETHPEQKAPYQVISSVRFINGGRDFTSNRIALSPGLNAIIGGKSTGKSLLAGLMVKSSDPEEYERRKGRSNANDLEWIKSRQPQIDFEVSWKDGGLTSLNDNEKNRKITYFPQHYLNSKINDKGVGNKELNKSIRNILSQTKIYNVAFQKYELGVQAIDELIASEASSFASKIRDLRRVEHSIKEKGSSENINKNINKLNHELSELKSQFDLTEGELQSHKDIMHSTKALTSELEVMKSNIDIISEITFEKIIPNLIPSKLLDDNYLQLNEQVRTNIESHMTSFAGLYATEICSIRDIELEKLRTNLVQVEASIEKNNADHLPILTKIQNSTPLNEKSKIIQEELVKLDEVNLIEANIKAMNAELDEIEQRLLNYLEEKIECCAQVKQTFADHPFTTEDDLLKIVIAHKCKSDHVQGILKERTRYQSNIELRNFINSQDFDDDDIRGYKERLDAILKQARSNTLEMKGEHKLASVVQEVLNNAIYMNYDIKLGDDSFSIMSPGKRALALLRVLVELDQSQHPIVLDQPEDDLDNRSVYDGLAKYLEKKKKGRQIIVVTHNPNVVVGADSEQIIVANQSGQESGQDNRGYKFEYVYGGLECSFIVNGNPYVLEKQGIREHVCEILDGGETAFIRREKLYSGFRPSVYESEAEEENITSE